MTIDSPSIDQHEIRQFQRVADTWWDPSGPFWPLHRLNAVRIEWIIEQLSLAGLTKHGQQPLAGLCVLDVGCGGGILSESLAALGATVTGIDVVEKNIAIAQSHASNSGLAIDYRLTTVEALSESADQYDIVFNMEVVEHVADLSSFMNACNRLLKPSGKTFIATINRNWLAWFIAIFGAEQVLRWLPKGTHRYALLRKPSELENQLALANIAVKAKTGVAVNPITKNMHLTGHTMVNYMLFAEHKPH